jgi:sigma-E factor negative regulatory protein RseC
VKTLRQTAIVKNLLTNDMAQISVIRQSACGHDCASCGGGCGAGSEILTEAKNPLGAQIGDTVEIESSGIIWAAFVVYIIPIICFIIGYGVTSALKASENISIIVSIGAFFLGLIPAKLLNRSMERHSKSSVIVSIKNPKQ